jgi:6-phosphogluconolactonase/glucosamine-6-phosphate isomerase/deaminase
MRFVKTDAPAPVADYLAERITLLLGENKRVLLLLSGGSAIKVAAALAPKLQDARLPGLAVTLTDERYGEPGHPDSNWKQLLDAGFSLPGAVLVPVLQGNNMDDTVAAFDGALRTAIKHADYCIGLFGIGADGHTAGILPLSPAVTASGMAFGYDGGKYQRVTMTAGAITQLDEAVVYAVGSEKWPVIQQLHDEVSVDQQPAQLLKQVGRVTIYNDHQGDMI